MADYEIQREVDGHLIVFDRATSERMAGIRQKNTSPELAVRKILHGLGLRFRINNRDLPGSPDVANRKKRWAIFVHGCYWHRHPGCSKATTPKRNREFWLAKFEANVTRDRRAAQQLEALGYRTLVVWECETKARMARITLLLSRILLVEDDIRIRRTPADGPTARRGRAARHSSGSV